MRGARGKVTPLGEDAKLLADAAIAIAEVCHHDGEDRAGELLSCIFVSSTANPRGGVHPVPPHKPVEIVIVVSALMNVT